MWLWSNGQVILQNIMQDKCLVTFDKPEFHNFPAWPKREFYQRPHLTGTYLLQIQELQA